MKRDRIFKKTTIKSQIIIMVIVLGTCLTFAQEANIKILSTEPSLDVRDHKQYDVEVYTTISFLPDHAGEQLYAVAIFRNEGDTLRCYQAFYGNNEVFNRAFFKWENDTMVTIRLHNTRDNKNKSFKVFGRGSTTGIITDE